MHQFVRISLQSPAADAVVLEMILKFSFSTRQKCYRPKTTQSIQAWAAIFSRSKSIEVKSSRGRLHRAPWRSKLLSARFDDTWPQKFLYPFRCKNLASKESQVWWWPSCNLFGKISDARVFPLNHSVGKNIFWDDSKSVLQKISTSKTLHWLRVSRIWTLHGFVLHKLCSVRILLYTLLNCVDNRATYKESVTVTKTYWEIVINVTLQFNLVLPVWTE